jgi:type VI secretion system protein ImpC
MSKFKSVNFGKVVFGTEDSPAAEVPDAETPFRMLLLGNFRGQAKPAQDLAGRRPVAIDRDNFDRVLARFGVQVQVPVAGSGSVSLSISDIEDFHPDHLYEKLDLFAALRDLRQRLSNTATFQTAADEFRTLLAVPEKAEPAPKDAPVQPQATPDISPEALLDQILGSSAPQETSAKPGGGSDWKRLLHGVVSKHTVPNIEAEQQAFITQVDAAINGFMNDVLHHPAFQEVESAWRGVAFLVRRLETDHAVKLYLLDVSKEELATDLDRDDMQSSALFHLLVEQTVGTPGALPWSLLVGNYTFDRTREDALLLARVSQLASLAGAPFLAGATSRVFGCLALSDYTDPRDWESSAPEEVEQVWKKLRSFPESAYLGLLAPRFLLRLPYGQKTDQIERFRFEEMPGVSVHEAYLWGNPAFAAAYLIGQAFMAQGWGLMLNRILEVDGLPLCVYDDDGEDRVKPCAEFIIGDRAFEAILDAGVMPLLTVANQDKARLARFQSLAEPATALAGRWR